MFKYSPSIILRNYLLEVFVGEGCGRKKDGVGDCLGKLLGHDDVILTGFFIEEVSYRRYQKLKKVFQWINMVKVRYNRT